MTRRADSSAQRVGFYTRRAWLGFTDDRTELYEGTRGPQKAMLAHVPAELVGQRDLDAKVHHADRLSDASVLRLTEVHRESDGVTLVYEWPGGTNLQAVVNTLERTGDALPFEIIAQIGLTLARTLRKIRRRLSGSPKSLGLSSVLIAEDGRVLLSPPHLELGELTLDQQDANRVATLLYCLCAGQSPAALDGSHLSREGVPLPLIAAIMSAMRPSARLEELEFALARWQSAECAGIDGEMIARFFKAHRLFAASHLQLLPPVALDVPPAEPEPSVRKPRWALISGLGLLAGAAVTWVLLA